MVFPLKKFPLISGLLRKIEDKTSAQMRYKRGEHASLREIYDTIVCSVHLRGTGINVLVKESLYPFF